MSCTDSDPLKLENLASYLENATYETGGVIACAASDNDTNEILAFYYPEQGAVDIRYYETINSQVDENDFSNYSRIDLPNEPFFNGYLGKFVQSSSQEKWIVLSYEFEGIIKISNPIRSRQTSKPTVWESDVTIDQEASGMPKFSWPNNAVGDNAIYFQVISDAENNLLSATYTYENNFQFYKTDNVVLNVTEQTPPLLILGNSYIFTLMDVSENNWVNLVIIKTFEAA